jgi:hypothetical protein
MFYWGIAFGFYRLTNVMAQHYFGGAKRMWDVAQEHGMSILELEAKAFGSGEVEGTQRWLEWRIQQWFLMGADNDDWRGIWLTILNRGYSLIHIPGTVG